MRSWNFDSLLTFFYFSLKVIDPNKFHEKGYLKIVLKSLPDSFPILWCIFFPPNVWRILFFSSFAADICSLFIHLYFSLDCPFFQKNFSFSLFIFLWRIVLCLIFYLDQDGADFTFALSRICSAQASPNTPDNCDYNSYSLVRNYPDKYCQIPQNHIQD